MILGGATLKIVLFRGCLRPRLSERRMLLPLCSMNSK